MIEIFLSWLYVESHNPILPAEGSQQIHREWIRDDIFIPFEYREMLQVAAFRYRIPFQVLVRLGYSESWLNPKAVRYHKGTKYRDLGMWQWNEKWLHTHRRELGWFDPMDPGQSTEKAARKFKRLYVLTGSWYEAALAYKCGFEGRKDAPEAIKEMCKWVSEGTKPYLKRS